MSTQGSGVAHGRIARTDSPLLRPALLYVKSTRVTLIGPPGVWANHWATSCSVDVNGSPRRRT